MRIPSFTTLLSALLAFTPVSQAQTTNATYLTATALVTKADNNTHFECWQLAQPFKTISTPGQSGTQALTVGNVTNLAYTILPPRFDGGVHNAPAPQLVHFLSGVALVTLPHNASANLWVVGGAGGLLFAVDTTGTGHRTQYPSDQTTVGITIPLEGAKIPAHTVLANGPCEGRESWL